MSYKSQDITVDLINSAKLYQQGDGTYPTGTSADGSNALSGSTYLDVGQRYDGSRFYDRYRWFVNFNLPAHYMLLDAVLHYKVYGVLDAGSTFYLQVRGSSANVPPALADWPDYGSTVLDSKLSSNLTAGNWYEATIPASLLASVVKLSLTTDREIAGTEPTGDERAQIYANTGSLYLTIQVPLESQAPTEVGIIPLSDGQHTLASGIYHAAGTNGNTQCTQIQIQISNASDFSNILYDTGKIALDTPLNDGEGISRILDWFPSSEGTYYIRIATWDDDNKDLDPVWGDGNFTVGYPSIQSLDYKQNKEHFTFTTQIKDTYTKPPVVSLVVDNQSWLMELKNRIANSDGTYTYSHQKTLALERGSHEYHIEVGNVWTVLIGDTNYLEAQYTLNNTPRVEILLGNTALNAWNVVLTEKLLPDFSTLQFTTDTFIDTGGDITAKVYTNDYKEFTFTIKSITKSGSSKWRVSCISKAKEDFEQVVSFSAEAINSLDLLKSVLPDYTFVGTLDETVILQQFIDTTIKDIVSKILILNGKYAVERNKRIIIFDKSTPVYIIGANDPGLSNFSEDRSMIVNKIREYYTVKQYPVPQNAITLFDSSNWSGTVSDVQQTDIGLLGSSPSFLKANGTIYRSVDFKITDFDHLHLQWNPETATSIEIRLETDASNYYTYTHGFGGQKGAGFVLTGSSASDTVSKSITFTQTKIHKVEGHTSDTCTVKIQLKLAGSVVTESDWMTTNGNYFGQVFSNVDADEIVLQFTDLYVVTSSWGVNCIQLNIEQYVQKYQATGSKTFIAYRNSYSGTTPAHPQIYSGGGWVCPMEIDDALLGNAYPLNDYDTLHTSGSAYIKCTGKNKSTGGTFRDRHFPVAMNIYQKDGKYYASFSFCPNSQGEYDITAISPIVYYDASIWIERTTSVGEYVWVYKALDWSESYNLWDDVNIPLSSFSRVGSPSSQINTIRLVASGDNYYDNLYLTSNNPNVYYVEVKDDDSVNEWGLRFRIRKTDGFSSKEAATAFAQGLVNLFKDPIRSFTKEVSIETPIDVGIPVNYGGMTIYVYQITYDFQQGKKILQVGMNTSSTLEFLKSVSRKIEALERTIM